ncbi:MAG TPA: CvpA family protein [Ignavibacteria bacterium]|nr:CvpA family protein [Ignavibacteria bacterium]
MFLISMVSNSIDLIVIILVLIPAGLGLKSGLLRSVFSLAGIITGLFLATRFNDKLISSLSFVKMDPKLLSLISFIGVIILCYFISVYIAGKISKLNAVTKTFDKIFGAIFGTAKGLIIASLFLIFTTNTFNLFAKDTISNSKFYLSVFNIAPDVYDYLMKFFPDAKGFYDELNKIIFTTSAI